MNESSCSSGVRSFKADHAPSLVVPRRPRRPRDEARNPPTETTSEATEVIAAVEGAGREPSKGLGAERALPESDIHCVAETLHPGDHRRPAPAARPSFRQAVKDRPERPPKTDSERRPNASHVSGEAEPTRIAGVRRDLALPQRQRNPVILDKGAG